ncbi:pentapeptide repeat protein (plasmid) [Leptolyngbya boryana NIES-2135]|jgi:superfamily I DNA and RNA helicase|uniref:Pentapeptide repeat protein n=1 Tax=Leptolyngbya boryana NIES-2135 TaxID=1973484 RepID=A0A1Z4JS93_LEPBY|nr:MULTISPECIES: nuclease-related domain-containing DEAD/DEAH box helicase [Leptolyngbya]BAY59592.1 pentapeptide repeat protein [Leptolyngbya boryana NIES-2135]MBD2371609.1 ATP-binding domain-containing protein [Leptolyngbya sp. FACHB-161]MBD2378171.1 ATP-binding domain-containing protein [Leptolyngbya sp. FACHB-238]MBD2402574.1 ATP-binding domain-containing protein [Leptolyngbya sp. FACHB-239]MBD2409100.1 ATP-binding domain-containing protein [Leptolyngbya sp. FACHB-402]
MADWEFIVSEVFGGPGEDGERLIWEKVTQALKGTGEGIACLNYTYFNRDRQLRYQPDVLLVNRDQGITVIEVKSFAIDQLVEIRANQWEMQNFYTRYLYPFRQGENQLRQILRSCDRRKALRGRMPGRVLVALPCVTRDEWQARGFDVDHPTCPPLIFGDELGRRSLRDALEYRALPIERGEQPLNLSNTDWRELRHVIVGGSRPVVPVPPPSIQSRSDVLSTLQTFIGEFDQQQAKIGIQIPPGPQRIRGIAGSGKTLLLCQKAARMHLQHPDWDIALVFFTRSLYQLVPEILRTWLHEWSNGELEPDFVNGKLKVLHAWGARDRAGLYSLLRNQAGGSVLTSAPVTGSIPERLAANCKRLLENHPIQPTFDAILIDEGQDLLTRETLQIEDKQAIYWLAWQALRPVNPHSDIRRLIWAYDEAQSLDSLKVPSYREVFGTELGALLSGQRTGGSYPGGIQKSEVMKRCYRTPGPILVAAHALGMGLLRPTGMLSGFTTQQDWQQMGYEVEGDFRRSHQPIKLHRPPENSPNPVPQLWQQPLLEFEAYSDRAIQFNAIAKRLRHHIDEEGLQPSRDLLVIVLGGAETEESSQRHSASFELQRQFAQTLRSHGIDYYLPGASTTNQPTTGMNQNVDTFWMSGAITVSRIHRAKGHEAKFVYILGLESVAQQEDNLLLRNQLFVALTRSQAWVHLSGIKDAHTYSDYLLYDEVRRVIASGTTLRFTYRKPSQRSLVDEDEIEPLVAVN